MLISKQEWIPHGRYDGFITQGVYPYYVFQYPYYVVPVLCVDTTLEHIRLRCINIMHINNT